MNIAIVEDLAQDCERISSCLSRYMTELGLTYQLYTYENAEKFVEALNTLTFRIVFMDIYLQGMTGMEAAVCLRRRNRDCKLIFLTISTEHCLEGFRVNACHYLVKPFSDHDFTEAMRRCHLQPTYDGIVLQKNNRYLSRKDTHSKRFGIGLESVKNIIRKHNGSLDIYPKETIFRVGITLPLK